MHSLRLLTAVALSLAVEPAPAQTVANLPAIARTENRSVAHPYAPHVADAARRFGIPESWIWNVMRVESGGDPHAVSRAGAMGLMQLMPATWAALRARLGLGNDPFDLRDNILAGTAYLRTMHDRYGSSTAMLAAYNAGPGRYEEYLSRGRPLPAETRAYLAKLAPTIGSTNVVQAVPAGLASSLGWRRGGLFVRTGTGPSSTTPRADTYLRGSNLPAVQSTADGELEYSRGAPEGRPQSQADRLFVRRSDAGRPQ